MKPVGEFYDEHASKQLEQDVVLTEAFKEERRAFLDCLPGQTVLDAGCGPGRDMAWFQDHGCDVVGVDVAPAMVDHASDIAEAYAMDIRDLDFERGRFDGVWCSASLFFMSPEDMRVALNEFYRVLCDSGYLYCSVKLADVTKRSVKEKWGSEVEEYHLSHDDITTLLTDAGFTIRTENISTSHTGNRFGSFFADR